MVEYSQLKKNTNIRQYNVFKIQNINKKFSIQKFWPPVSIKRKCFDNVTQFSQRWEVLTGLIQMYGTALVQV